MDYVQQALEWKHGSSPTGTTIRLHRRRGYHTPDAHYEAALLRLVGPDTRWLDVGCGRSPCPFNPHLAAHLAQRCALLAGVDASANIAANPYLHRAIRSNVAAMNPDAYDLVTMRMVAEHVAEPDRLAAMLRRLVAPGGTLLIYTVHAASPSALVGKLAPQTLHRLAMRGLFRGEDRDVFPAYYRMNTIGQLRWILRGFEARQLSLLDDCRLTLRRPKLHAAELALWSIWRRTTLAYPECCILGEFTPTTEPP